MLVIAKKSGSGIGDEGIFDFGKILLKKALNSNLIKRASQAINSDAGKKAISAVKRAAQSDVGQELQARAISEVKKKVNKILPPKLKQAVNSEFRVRRLFLKLVKTLLRN